MPNGKALVDLYQHLFKTPSYRHQLEDTARLLDNQVFGLFSEMGTGKTKTVIDAACILRKELQINVVLVDCPAAVRSVWINPDFGEVKKHAWLPSRVFEFHAPVRCTWSDPDPELEWVVTNYEYLRSSDHQQELLKLLHGGRILMVLDESSFIKSRTAAQTKACMTIGKTVDRKIILNGTPIGNNPFDLWSQMEFLSPRIFPYKNFFHFRSEFAVMGGWHNHQVLQWKNLDRLQEHVAPFVVRREKKDCLDLPDKIYTQLEVPLTEATWQKYKEMRDDAVVWLDENPSMAAQAGVRIMRLSQMTAGFLGGVIDMNAKPEDVADDPKAVEIGREKLEVLRTWVQERLVERPTRKIIVWCRFRPELERVARELADILPTYRLYGQSKAERAEAISHFSTFSNQAALLAAQQQAGGFGLNLVAADTVVYMSNTFSLMTRLQSEDRVHRPGQTKHVVYLDVLATGPKGQRTIDHHVVKALRNKHDLATWTVSAWRKALTEEV